MNIPIGKSVALAFTFSFFMLANLAFGLDAAQLQVIQEAVKRQYKVEWLKHPDSGQEIVVVGETHLVSRERYNVAKQMVQKFSLIGIEGARACALPAPLTTSGSMNHALTSKVGIFPGPIKLAREKLGGDLYESLREIVYLHRNHDENFQDALRRGFPVSDEQSLLLLPGLDPKITANEGTITDIMLKAEDYLRSKGVVELEFFDPIPDSLRDLSLAQATAGNVNLSILAQQMTADRDAIMSRNILRTLESQATNIPFLILVGEFHLDGIVTHLEASGFNKIALPPTQLSCCAVM